jgi:hypothetical protein
MMCSTYILEELAAVEDRRYACSADTRLDMWLLLN